MAVNAKILCGIVWDQQKGEGMCQARYYFIMLACALVSGCATQQQLEAMSSYQLCYTYAKYQGTLNIHQSARAKELERRGENCMAYQGQVARQLGAERQAQQLQAEEELKHQRQLELEKAKATQIIINQPPAVQSPAGYNCYNYGTYSQCVPY
ncbi:MAG: hypothetical protein K2X06_04790 [Burkholderiales bacterium]|nr:hypothetical protein [Burkholderiales bacterium]